MLNVDQRQDFESYEITLHTFLIEIGYSINVELRRISLQFFYCILAFEKKSTSFKLFDSQWYLISMLQKKKKVFLFFEQN